MLNKGKTFTVIPNRNLTDEERKMLLSKYPSFIRKVGDRVTMVVCHGKNVE